MALAKRIIPCLDIAAGKVVKGVHFVDLVSLGDPLAMAKRYEEELADELVFLDITATQEKRETMYDLVKQAAPLLSLPLTVGGGIRSTADFSKLLASGADKVSINSAAVKNPDLIGDASARFGKQSVVVAIDAKRVGDSYQVFIGGGREHTGMELVTWAKRCENLGAGEILLTSMDGDGTQAGYDIPMTRAVCQAVNIPVIASGGCGEIEDIVRVFKETDCAAALVASLFHYGKATAAQVKAAMRQEGILCG